MATLILVPLLRLRHEPDSRSAAIWTPRPSRCRWATADAVVPARESSPLRCSTAVAQALAVPLTARIS